jgi:hypothetical protein
MDKDVELQIWQLKKEQKEVHLEVAQERHRRKELQE